MGVYDAALAWCRAGASVVPPAQDGTKRPLGEWRHFMSEAASFKQIDAWYGDGTRTGVGLVMGKISGNLEMLELEGRATGSGSLDAILWECQARGVEESWYALLNDGYLEWTPSGGLHMIYRVIDHDVPGNTKIARRPATPEELAENPLDKIKTLSETRGEGGYVVVAPTHGTVHPSGQSWDMPEGVKPGVVLKLTWDVRCKIHEAIHAALDQMPAVEPPAPRPRPTLTTGDKRPGDDFNEKITWQELLLPLGWEWVYRKGDKEFLRRPGKSEGVSATISATTDRLWVFSSSTEFEPEHHYSKFEAYALLEHGGNFANAAKELSTRGFGTQRAAAPSLGVLEMVEPPAAEVSSGMSVSVPTQTQAAVASESAAPLTHWKHDSRLDPNVVLSVPHNLQGSATIFSETFKPWFKYHHDDGNWWGFDGKTWDRDGYAAHELACQLMINGMRDQAKQMNAQEPDSGANLLKFVNKIGNAASPSSVTRWSRAHPGVAAREKDFDPDNNLVTMDNGVLDLEGRVLHPHSPSFMNTKMFGAAYDPQAKAPRWEKFLDEVIPDRAVQLYLQKAIGHTMTGRAEQRAMFLLHGESGSGKSQFIKVMELMFGDFAETAAATTFTAVGRNASITNDLNDLKGSRFVSISELDQDEKMAEALLKRITGGDTAKSRALWQENTKWKVQFTLWMATNHLPRLNSDDNAMWRRVKPINFPMVIKDHGKEEPRLAEKIYAEESAGILNWMLEGLRLYLEEGLDDIEAITEGVERYRSDVDVVKQFLNDQVNDGALVAGETERTPVRTLHNSYVEWSKRNNTAPLGERRFSQRMSSLGFDKKIMNMGTVFVGIGMNPTHGFAGMMGGFHPRQ